MDTIRHLCGALAVILATCPQVPAQVSDAPAADGFSGTYLSDCGDSSAARVTVSNDSLIVIDKDCRLAGGGLQPAWSYFGNAPPDGYVVALLATTSTGQEMLGLVFEDSTGLTMTIDAAPLIPGATGCLASGRTFHRCGRKPSRPTLPGLSTRTYELRELSASGILLDPLSRGLWYAALGPLVEESWLGDLDGPSGENSLIRVDGVEYLLASACKNHDCYENNAVILYSAERHALYAKVYLAGNSILLGAPPPPLHRELERRWLEFFRHD